jgi:hypothetical protein
MFTGCENPSGPQISISGNGQPPNNYQITVTARQTVYSGPQGTLVAEVQDKVSRTDGGTVQQDGRATVVYERPMTNYTFRASVEIRAGTGGSRAVTGVVGWSF